MDQLALQCVGCQKIYRIGDLRYRCDCGEIFEIKNNISVAPDTLSVFDQRLGTYSFPGFSGVWRYKELIAPIPEKYIITKPEGNTNLYKAGKSVQSGLKHIGEYAGIEYLYLKHEGENPTGSFKDRGMTVGISYANYMKAKAVACASTGNTSSSLASYAAQLGIPCFVFIPKGKITSSKLAQSIGYGAIHIQLKGDFDLAMQLVEKICVDHQIYLLNSINPFRIEGQKTIAFELLQQLGWQSPDWIVLPGGNLGNTSAIGKGLLELKEKGLTKKIPRIAVIQAQGANPFYKSYKTGFRTRYAIHAQTIASAIKIGNPVSFLRAKKIIEETEGVVEQVTDREIIDAKKIIDGSGIGCEPASAATVAGIKKLVKKGIISINSLVVGILTGHILKDPETILNSYSVVPIDADNHDLSAIIKRLLSSLVHN